MSTVFADSFYWIALNSPTDPWCEPAKRVSRSLGACRIITTDEVLAEFLTHFSKRGEFWRMKASRVARAIMRDPNVEVVPQSRGSFLAGLALYEQRPDKRYSLPDCIAFRTMRERGLTEALTHDHDYEREGFVILLRD